MALKTFAATVHFFDSRGARIAILERDQVSTLQRQMPFNGGQTMSLSIPRGLAREELCRHGNLITIESDSGVELFGGCIRGRRSWSLEGPTLTVMSWETFLGDLYTPQLLALRGMTAGRMVDKLLTDALGQTHVPIVAGQVSDAGPVLAARDFRGESILSVVQALGEGGRVFDWWCETVWDDNQSHPQGVFTLTPRAGRKTGVLLAEGYNVESVQKSDDDGNAVSTATVIGNSDSGWGERPVATETDAVLAAALGWPRTAVAVRSDLTSVEAARLAAKGMLSGIKESLVVSIGNQNGEWASIRNGDTVMADLPSYDFSDMATGYREPVARRVIGRTVDEASGVMTLQLVAE